ncbi:hypothetical protein [Streptomyces lydicus]|uniref:hypothetical protein n=1 Tax=Streptomyces lydicus TaxID=47763 RepID=UPI0010115537|nr:hypothetical protein [Streptomyces lydicus]MCZ1012325.1 hypothetical protein [Streptomyces lydicus]
MDFQIRTGTQTITVTVTDPDEPAPIQIDCDGRALAGLDLRTDGTLTLGHWPDSEQWETAPARQQIAARLFEFIMGQAQRAHGAPPHDVADPEAADRLATSDGPFWPEDNQAIVTALRYLDPARFGPLVSASPEPL